MGSKWRGKLVCLRGTNFWDFLWRSEFGFIDMENECQLWNHEIAPGCSALGAGACEKGS